MVSETLINSHTSAKGCESHTIIIRFGYVWTNHLLKDRYEEANLVLI